MSTKLASDARDLGALTANVNLTFHQKSGEDDQLLGSVISQDIQELLEKQGYKIDRKKIVLDHPIKTLAITKSPSSLHREVAIDLPVASPSHSLMVAVRFSSRHR